MRNGLAALGLAAACLCAPSPAHAQTAMHDPWEGFNRRLYAFNDALDRGIFEPVARGYRAITPQPVRHGVTNFLNNLHAPVIFVNDLLQGHPGEAGKTAARFGVNTTVGVLGLFDPATDMGLERRIRAVSLLAGAWAVERSRQYRRRRRSGVRPSELGAFSPCRRRAHHAWRGDRGIDAREPARCRRSAAPDFG
jgi:phospholipid-binding lipoprotein MlaA